LSISRLYKAQESTVVTTHKETCTKILYMLKNALDVLKNICEQHIYSRYYMSLVGAGLKRAILLHYGTGRSCKNPDIKAPDGGTDIGRCVLCPVDI
jgi:hypothetical protein